VSGQKRGSQAHPVPLDSHGDPIFNSPWIEENHRKLTSTTTRSTAAQTNMAQAITAIIFILVAIWFIANFKSLTSSSSTGTGGSLNWNQTVQGQYCSDPVNGAVAQGLSNGSGESLNSICTKMWAVDRSLNKATFDPTAPYDPFAP
jgi:hypothetical protein